MQSVPNVSSEEELLQLRDEGKISEAEYEDLLAAMKERGKLENEPAGGSAAEPRETSGLAIASLVLALALGPLGCIPAVICGHLALRRMNREAGLAGRGLALAGLIVGYIVLGFSLVLVVLCFMVYGWRAQAESPTMPASVVIAPSTTTELRRFALDDMQGLISRAGVQIDRQTSVDGNGSLRIEAVQPTTVRLFEAGDIDIDNALLIYRAHLRTQDVQGQVYLEMWCSFAGRGEFFSRSLDRPLTGTTEWTKEQTPFVLDKGQNPDNVKLNLVIDGSGTVWIDDIRLLKGRPS
jgi:hypothetical protein